MKTKQDSQFQNISCRERENSRERFRQILGAQKSGERVVLLKGARGCETYEANVANEDLNHPQLDHFKYFMKNGQGFILDEPYGLWWKADDEPHLKRGWRILYLPPQMSTYLVGVTYPRLLAPPNSQIDLLRLLELLELAGFRGNEVKAQLNKASGWWYFDEIARHAEISKRLNLLEKENVLI